MPKPSPSDSTQLDTARKHHNGHTSLDQMCGRGKTLRTRADYSHRQDVFHSNLTHPLTNIDG